MMGLGGEHIARRDTNGAGHQLIQQQLHKCLTMTERLNILAAGVVIGALMGWGL